MRAVRITAVLFVVLAGAAFAGPARRGWTKVHLTHANGGSGPFPAALIEKRGGELLVVNPSDAVAYVPANAILALQADARKEGITVAVRDEFDVLHLPSSARIDTREGIGDDVPNDQRFQGYPGNKPGLFVLQFVAPPRAEWVSELTAMGWTMTRYIHTNGYIVTGGPELIGRTKQLPYIQFLDFFHPYQKAKQLVADGQPRDLVFLLPAGVDTSDALAAITAAAENGVDVYRGNVDTLVYARMPHGKAVSLMHHPLVVSVFPRPVGGLSDERQAMSLTTNLNTAGSQPTTPTGYTTWLTGRCSTCSGMNAADWRIGVADSGLDDGTLNGGHADLAGRKYFGARLYAGNNDNCADPDCDDYGHGTIVAGIAAGNASTGMTDDLGYYWGMGVAPWAGIFSTKVMTAVGLTIDLTRLFEFTRDAANNSVTIQNHSFNEYFATPEQSGLYSALARQYDIAVRDADDSLSTSRTPILIAVSAGNNNWPPSAPTNRFRVLGGATAKNVLSMGGAENYRPGVTGCNAPGDDFRNIMETSRTGTLLTNYIKPDLVAPAAPVTGPNSVELPGYTGYCMDNFFDLPAPYNGDSGTSFAAPVGAAASLIVKRYLGSSASATSPALAKAVLVAGAKSIRGGTDKTTNPDTTIGAFPNGQQGFGRVSFDDIITGSTPPISYDQTTTRTFTSGNGPFRIRLRVRDSAKPVKIALVWTDAPGTEGASNPLVNDLDLEVYRSSTPSYRLNGNYLSVTDTNKGEESTQVSVFDGTTGRDRTNNVEVVRAFLTANEEFDVQVTGYSIVGDTNGSSGSFEQDFALVAINADQVNSGNPIAPALSSSLSTSDRQDVVLTWTQAANLMNLKYEVWRGTKLNNMAKVGETTALTYTDNDRPLDTAYIYRVIATGNGGASATSNNTVATPIVWGGDTTITNNTVVKAVHWTDMRRGVDYVRFAADLSTGSWATPISTNLTTLAQHLNELRTKLGEAYTALSVTQPTYTTPNATAGVTVIKVLDVTELRSAIE